MQSSNKENVFTVPPKISLAYGNFKSVGETSTYRLFQGYHCNSHERHMIRILDSTKEFVNKNYERAATLFKLELFRLQELLPGSVLMDRFEINEVNKQNACGILPYLPLSIQFEESNEVFDSKDSKTIEKLLSDIISDVEFLWKNFRFRNIVV